MAGKPRFVTRQKHEKLQAERDAYRYVLEELVRLKDGPRGELYERDKPAAWQAARDALSD